MTTAMAALGDLLPALAAAQTDAARPGMSLWGLFRQSFDVFTILLLAGSVVGVANVLICAMEVREKNIAPPDLARRLLDAARGGRTDEVRDAAMRDDSFLSRVVRAGLSHSDKSTMREAAELAASEESARWFRKIDMLSVIGNLGPLVGLAGTVWGMILAFTSLGETGGQAGPAQLSLGISKALFHTLLGLCLAIPCLLAYGWYRGVVDRLCTRAIVSASEVIEALPAAERRG
ncbi:MAG TPA: MotA/TolQ/ExbB proton channel family protein [Phycisphaerales bacterium]|nr:MotA/TolQ/ExbB proton channel family protein [Phycisphaerales bacterium]